MSVQKLVLPSSSIFRWYEGADESQYTEVTGSNLNSAPDQLLVNDKLVSSVVSAIIGAADLYEVETPYGLSAVVKNAKGHLFQSIVAGNLGNDLYDTTKWVPIDINSPQPNLVMVNANTTLRSRDAMIFDIRAGNLTAQMPASPVDGDWVIIGTPIGSTGVLTVTSADLIMGSTDDILITRSGETNYYQYVDDGFTGWRLSQGSGSGGSGVPAFGVVSDDFTVEKESAYSINLTNGEAHVATIPDGLRNGDWFAISTLRETVHVEGGSVTVKVTTENWAYDEEFTDLVITEPNATYYFQKIDGKWRIVDGIGEKGGLVSPPNDGKKYLIQNGQWVNSDIDRKFIEYSSISDHGGIGDLISDDTDAVAAAMNSSENFISAPAGKMYKVTSFLNKMGKTIIGGGDIVKEIAVGIYQKINSYVDTNKNVCGLEYLGPFHKLIQDQMNNPTRKPILVFSGESPVSGVVIINGSSTPLAPEFLINNLVNEYAKSVGLQTPFGLNCINAGQPSKDIFDWVSTYIPLELAMNPDLLELSWGVNHARDNSGNPLVGTIPQLDPTRVSPEVWISKLREGLSIIRAARPFKGAPGIAPLTIILRTPNSTNDHRNARDSLWYEKINLGIKQAGRDFNCLTLDAYAEYQDSNVASQIWMDDPASDGVAIHPLAVMNRWLAGFIGRHLFPDGMSKTIGRAKFQSTSGVDDSGDPARLPSAYPYGVSISRALGTNGFPVNGTLVTTRSSDSTVLQILHPFKIGMNSYYIRVGRATVLESESVGWNSWIFIGRSESNLIPESGYSSPGAGGARAVVNNGTVVLEGYLLKNSPSIIAAGTVIATVPLALRPGRGAQMAAGSVYDGSIFKPVTLMINVGGQVNLLESTTVSAQRVYFSGSWSYIQPT